MFWILLKGKLCHIASSNKWCKTRKEGNNCLNKKIDLKDFNESHNMIPDFLS